MKRRMNPNRMLDSSFTDTLDEPVLKLGYTTWTRSELATELGLTNVMAARRLSHVLKRLKIRTALRLFNLGPDSLIRVRGIGNAATYVAMCILDQAGYSVERWWGWTPDAGTRFSCHQHHARSRAQRQGKHAA